MISFRTTALATGLCAALANCAPQIETAPVSAALEPAEATRHAVGDTWVSKVGDRIETSVLTSLDGVLGSGVNQTTGCEFTFFQNGFGPGPEWKNCGGSSGTQEVTREGSIFPLTVGATERWIVKNGRNEKGDTWETVRNCEVKGTARVTAPAGTFDTYHVRCEDTWRVRDWYWAPELGATVVSRNMHKSRGEVKLRELISFTRGAET